MKKKQFKAESKKLLDLMINSIYTNKDIFLRELISNASDAIDKIHYSSLTDKKIKLPKELAINIALDKDNKTITLSDNGCGMNEIELENNLGTIAESGSSLFKEANKGKDVNIIGQFGVGFYSTFMVASKVKVVTKPYNSDVAYMWESTGDDGYSITETTKSLPGTDIVLTLKEDTDDYKYSEYLDTSKIKELVSKYSNYISYPIKMEVTKKELKKDTKDEYEDVTEVETLNEMTPIWKKSNVKQDDYDNFYMDKFSDYEKPLKTIKYSVEGLCSFSSLLFIPSKTPFDYYTKNYVKGLQLYSNGVLIMDNCDSLLPEYYNFVKGVVDSEDLSLNISREMLQQDKQLKIIAKNISKKINSELKNMLENDRETYDKFFKAFGNSIKIGIYNSYGMDKDELQDLILFYSSKTKKDITLKEYVDNMLEKQDKIYYAVGESVDKIDLMPQVEAVKEKGYEILYLTEYADEFVTQVLGQYADKKFINVENSDLNVDSDEDKKELDKLNEDNKTILDKICESLDKKVVKVKFTNNLKNHPVCLTTEGVISNGMEKIMDAMPNEQNLTASKVLVINAKHPIAQKLQDVYKNHPEQINDYAKVLYAEARQIEGMKIDNPNEVSDIIFDLLSK